MCIVCVFTTGTINTTNLTAGTINATDVYSTNSVTTDELDCNVISAPLIYSSQIVTNNSLTRGTAKNINQNLSLVFPIDEYNIINQNNLNITVTLPTPVTDNNNTAFYVLLNVPNSTCTLVPQAGTLLYDMTFTSISSVLLSNSEYQTIKFMCKNSSWYIIDVVNFNTGVNFYKNNLTTPTFTKTFGNYSSNILATTITVDPTVNENINLSIPISLFRNGTNNSGGNQTQHFETINSVSASLYKNGVFNSNLTVTTTDTLPTTKQINHISSTFTYAQYVTNCNVSFLPALKSSGTDTYTVYLNISASYSVNFADNAGTVGGIDVNTNVSNTWNGVPNMFFISSSGASYVASNMTTSFYNANYQASSASLIQTNNILSNNISNQGTITSPNVTSTNVTATNLLVKDSCKSKYNLPGYLIDGGTIYQSYPILGSTKGFSPNNNDDLFFINPGFRMILYDGLNYTGSVINDFINDSNYPATYVPSTVNTTSSLRVYYRNNANEAYSEIAYYNLS